MSRVMDINLSWQKIGHNLAILRTGFLTSLQIGTKYLFLLQSVKWPTLVYDMPCIISNGDPTKRQKSYN